MSPEPTLPGTSEDAPAPIGHNNPPAPIPYDVEDHKKLAQRADAFMEASDKWLTVEIADDDMAGRLADQIDGLRKTYADVEAARVKYKKPHDDAGAAVQAAFTPILGRLKKAADALKKKTADYIAAKQAKIDAERAKAKADADEKERQARLLAAEAKQSGSIDDAIKAEEAAKEAEKEQKAADRPVRASVQSASGGGRTIAQRTTTVAKIVHLGAVLRHYRDAPEVREVIQRLANRDIKKGPVPGCEEDKITTAA